MSTQLELGKVCAVSVDHRWTLELQARVHFRPQNTNQFLPSSEILSRVKEQSLWISRANDLSLVVQVTKSDAHSLFPALKSAIIHAELWNQLELDVDLLNSATSHALADESTFVIGIRHSSSLQQENVKRPHRLNVGDSAADLRPPGATEVLELEQIFVNLNLEHKAEGTKPSRDRDDEAEQINKDELNQDDAEMLDAADSMILGVEDLSPLPLGRPPLSYMKHGPPAIFQCARTTSLPIDRTNPISTAAAIDLLDAAFRSLICPKPSKLALGVWLPQPTNDLSLSALAPSLLCPGYPKAVAERVCFLPTITHALGRSLLRRARSNTLRMKLERLRLNDDRNEDSRITTSLSQIVKARLWKTVQRGVYIDDAARRLKPLKAPSPDPNTCRQGDDSDDDDDDMLQPTPNDLVTVPLRARESADTRPNLSTNTLIPGSPILLGRFATCLDGNWDGGLLAQPISGDLLSRMFHTPDTEKLLSRFDKSGNGLVLDDDCKGENERESDSILYDEEYSENDSLLGDEDEDSILDDEYYNDSDSLLLDLDSVDQGEEYFVHNTFCMMTQGVEGMKNDDNDSLLLDFDSVNQGEASFVHTTNKLHGVKGVNSDDKSSPLFLKHTDPGLFQQDEDSLLRDDTSILDDSDSLLQDAEDTDIPFSSQESSLTAMTVHSDIDSTAKYHNHDSLTASNLPLYNLLPQDHERAGGNRSSNVYLKAVTDTEEMLMIDTIPSTWQNWVGKLTTQDEHEGEGEDEDMLGAELDDIDGDEEMLAFF